MENISQYLLQDIEKEFQDDKDIVLEVLKKIQVKLDMLVKNC